MMRQSLAVAIFAMASPDACSDLVYGQGYAPSPPPQHQPINRESFGYIRSQSGGMNPDGYFYEPQTSKSLWGVDLADGYHIFPAGWEDDQPGRTAIVYQVHEGNVIRQTYGFEGGRQQ